MKLKQLLHKLSTSLALITFANLLPPSRAHADALDQWTTNQLKNLNPGYNAGFGMQVLGVTYGNGLYVAVGRYGGSDLGFIESSEDGINWTVRGDGYLIPGSPQTLELHDVTYGNGTFVAVGWDYFGGANLYHSTNGINWTSHTNATVSNFYGVTYGGGRFVAVGDGLPPNGFSGTTNRNIYTSTDGITWTMRNSGSPVNDVHAIYDVAYGTGRFVAVDAAGYSYASTTGTTWTRGFFGGGSKINFGNGVFIVPVGPGTNLVSSDGLTWSGLTNNAASAFGRVIYGNGLFLALSSSSLFTSTDGTNWLQRNYPSTGMVDVVFGNRNAVAVGYSSSFPYLPLTFASDPLVAVNVNSGHPPRLNISGLLNHSYQIQYLTNLSGTNWQTLATLSLSNSPLLWTDTTATNSQRFYRAVLLP